jgi:hypothetical protein
VQWLCAVGRCELEGGWQGTAEPSSPSRFRPSAAKLQRSAVRSSLHQMKCQILNVLSATVHAAARARASGSACPALGIRWVSAITKLFSRSVRRARGSCFLIVVSAERSGRYTHAHGCQRGSAAVALAGTRRRCTRRAQDSAGKGQLRAAAAECGTPIARLHVHTPRGT